MDADLTPDRPRPRLALLTFIVIAAILVALFAVHRHEQRREAEDLARAQGLVRVLSATFSKQSALKVGEVSGVFDVTSVDPGAIRLLRSAQKVKLPYSIDYTVDLTKLSPRDYRWDAATRTLQVEAPAPVIGRPNIDEAHRETVATSGLFVTRGAADNLSRRAAVMANGAAVKEAQKPEHLAKARDNARAAIASMLETPLDVAGLGDVKVVVRFPEDGVRDGERWDVSPSIEEVLARRR
jgi:hypothetical protein